MPSTETQAKLNVHAMYSLRLLAYSKESIIHHDIHVALNLCTISLKMTLGK